jgi:hypothetical protein
MTTANMNAAKLVEYEKTLEQYEKHASLKLKKMGFFLRCGDGGNLNLAGVAKWLENPKAVFGNAGLLYGASVPRQYRGNYAIVTVDPVKAERAYASLCQQVYKAAKA